MLSEREWDDVFDDSADIIEVNGTQQLVSCRGDHVWQACIEAINSSGLSYVPFGEPRELAKVLKSASLTRQGDAKIYRLTV